MLGALGALIRKDKRTLFHKDSDGLLELSPHSSNELEVEFLEDLGPKIWSKFMQNWPLQPIGCFDGDSVFDAASFGLETSAAADTTTTTATSSSSSAAGGSGLQTASGSGLMSLSPEFAAEFQLDLLSMFTLEDLMTVKSAFEHSTLRVLYAADESHEWVLYTPFFDDKNMQCLAGVYQKFNFEFGDGKFHHIISMGSTRNIAWTVNQSNAFDPSILHYVGTCIAHGNLALNEPRPVRSHHSADDDKKSEDKLPETPSPSPSPPTWTKSKKPKSIPKPKTARSKGRAARMRSKTGGFSSSIKPGSIRRTSSLDSGGRTLSATRKLGAIAAGGKLTVLREPPTHGRMKSVGPLPSTGALSSERRSYDSPSRKAAKRRMPPVATMRIPDEIWHEILTYAVDCFEPINNMVDVDIVLEDARRNAKNLYLSANLKRQLEKKRDARVRLFGLLFHLIGCEIDHAYFKYRKQFSFISRSKKMFSRKWMSLKSSLGGSASADEGTGDDHSGTESSANAEDSGTAECSVKLKRKKSTSRVATVVQRSKSLFSMPSLSFKMSPRSTPKPSPDRHALADEAPGDSVVVVGVDDDAFTLTPPIGSVPLPVAGDMKTTVGPLYEMSPVDSESAMEDEKSEERTAAHAMSVDSLFWSSQIMSLDDVD